MEEADEDGGSEVICGFATETERLGIGNIVHSTT